MLGHCRSPDHGRKPQLESRDNGHSPLVSYRPCITYSFVPFSLPRPLNSLSPCIYSIFCLANCSRSLLRSWFHHTNVSPTSMIVPSFQGPPRRGHSHPFLHRLTKEISVWFNHFNELDSIPSSQLFPSDRTQTSPIHRSPHRLRPAVWLFRHSPLPKLAVTSFPTLCVSLHTWYTTQWPQSLPLIRAIVVSGLSLHTA